MSKVDTIINRAMQFVNEGQPYTYGGKNEPMNKSKKSYVQNTLVPNYQNPGKIDKNGHYDHLLGNATTNNGMNYKKFMDAESSPYVLIDCSGLTKVSFNAAGYNIGDGSYGQLEGGRKLATEIDPKKNASAVKPGALLRRKGHVAVMGYNGTVIEAKGWKYGCVSGLSSASDFTSAFNIVDGKGSGGSSETPKEEVPKSTAPVIGMATVTGVSGSYLNVRSGAGTGNSIIGKLYDGVEVRVTGKVDGWYQINYSGKVGYISSKYATYSDGTSGAGNNNSNDQKSNESGSLKITASALNVRSKNSTSGQIMGVLSKGTVVSYSGEDNGWYKISYKGTVGWISAKYAEVTSAAPAKQEEKKPEAPKAPESTGSGKTMYVTASSLNVRESSNASSTKIGALSKGTAVSVLKTQNGWHMINYNQKTGWICGDYVSETKPKASGNIMTAYEDYQNYLSNGLESVKKDTSKKSYDNEEAAAAKQIEAKFSKIDEIAQKANIPREVVAGIWYREMSFRDGCYLHNGDPLGTATVHVPKGIYFGTHQFVEAAVHALNLKRGLADQMGLSYGSKDYAAMCAYCEAYNGFGYRNKGTASAYVSAGTEKYTGGMYVADGVFSSTTKDSRVGVLRIFMMMAEKYPR